MLSQTRCTQISFAMYTLRLNLRFRRFLLSDLRYFFFFLVPPLQPSELRDWQQLAPLYRTTTLTGVDCVLSIVCVAVPATLTIERTLSDLVMLLFSRGEPLDKWNEVRPTYSLHRDQQVWPSATPPRWDHTVGSHKTLHSCRGLPNIIFYAKDAKPVRRSVLSNN